MPRGVWGISRASPRPGRANSPPRVNLSQTIPFVSIVVPFWGYLFRILNIKSVKPKKRNYNGDYRYAADADDPFSLTLMRTTLRRLLPIRLRHPPKLPTSYGGSPLTWWRPGYVNGKSLGLRYQQYGRRPG